MPNASEMPDNRRFAVVDGLKYSRSQVAAYLPDNYKIGYVMREGYLNQRILIVGEDKAGWTLDGYVIPRLASGLIFAYEKGSAEEIRAQSVPAH